VRGGRSSREGGGTAGSDDFLAGVPLWPRVAHGQDVTDTTARARYPLLDAIDGARLGRGRWTYAGRLIVDGLDTTSRGTQMLTLAAGSEPGTLIFTMDRTDRHAKPGGDSLVVRVLDLRLLRHTFYRLGKSRTRDFSRDTVPRVLTWKSVDFGLHSTLYRAVLLLQVTPLDRDWRGSVYLPRLVGEADPPPGRWVLSPLDMRVAGDEMITTPAGRFDCWKLEASFRDRRALVWVSKSPQWVVKLAQPHGSDGVWEQLLTSATPSAP
jgi:hypothetical protein